MPRRQPAPGDDRGPSATGHGDSAAAGFRAGRRSRRPFWSAIVAVMALVAAGAGWWLLRPAGGPGRPAGGSVSTQALNLVIITLDTTRADFLGAYGSRDVETPALDRLAREGVLFEQAMTSAPLTLPAHSTIFTSRFPPEHGVRDNGGFFDKTIGHCTPQRIVKNHVLEWHCAPARFDKRRRC